MDVFDQILRVYSELARLHRMLGSDPNQDGSDARKNVARLMALISVVMINRMIARHPELDVRTASSPQVSEADPDTRDQAARLDQVARVMECGRRLRDILSSVSGKWEAPERAEYELAAVQSLGRLYWTILVPLCAGRPPVEAFQFIGRELAADDLLWLE